MRRTKRLIALFLVFSLIISFVPMSYVSNAEGAESTYSETLLLSDTFDENTSWNTTNYNWRLVKEQYAGVRNGTAPLGYDTLARNLYKGNGDSDNTLADVHIKADVCVKAEYVSGELMQYHFLVARGANTGLGSIAFGFKTKNAASASSLIVGNYIARDNVEVYYESEANYEFGKEYTLELLVVGNLVIAICEGETVFAQEVETVDANGFYGIVSHRATSNTAGGIYGTDYEKGGYFDNFSISEVTNLPTVKKIVDFEVAEETYKIPVNGTLNDVSVIPVYAWPYGKGEAITEGITVNGLDNQSIGIQKVTVSFEGISKEMTVNVIDDSIEFIVDHEKFASNPFSDAEWETSSNIVVDDGKVVMNGAASATTSDTFANGYLEAKVALAEWTASEDGTKYPMTLFSKLDGTSGVYVRLAVKKSGDTATATMQTYVYLPGESSPNFANPISLSDFEWGKEYTIRLTCIGNYYEVRLNDEVKVQRTLNPNEDISNSFVMQEGQFGFKNVAGVTASLDNLTIVKYTPFEVSKEDTIALSSYSDFTTASVYNERTSFIEDEQLELTVLPGEGEQLAAVDGLNYYLNDTSDVVYSITDRLGNAGENQSISDKFLLNMPAGAITVTDNYYTIGADEANVGIIGVSIREKTQTKKYGIRFSSRAYMEYVGTDGTSYQLTEVGTILLKERDEVTVDMLNGCYESDSGTYLDERGSQIGKKVKATRAQDICNDYVDWGLVLAYEDNTILFDVEYTAYSYAVYESAEGDVVVKYATNPKTYSYNDVADKVGYEKQKASYLFYDVFSSGYREEWSFSKDVFSSYGIENGKFSVGYAADATSASALSASVTGGEAWQDYAVSADVVFDSTTGITRGRSIGLTARNSGNYYYEFRMQYTESDSQMSAILYRFGKSGTEAVVSLSQAKLQACLGDSITLGLDTQYNMRLEVRGSHIRCYVDGVRVIAYEDTSDDALSSGTAGLKSANNIATYEDFIVEAKETQTIVGLQLSGTTNNVVELYEGFNIDIPSYTLKVLDEDGTYQTVALTQEMISEYDNTILGEQEITLTYKDFSYPAKVLISERPDELAAFEKAVTDAKTAVDSSSATEETETIKDLKEQYDSFSPYELTKVNTQILEIYEELQEALERANDSNLTSYTKLLADTLNNVTEDTWNESIMGNGAKWIALNGTLYQAQTPYNLAVEGWHSPDVYGEIYSMSADMTMLSENMNMGIAMNMSQTGCYYARVINTELNGAVSYRVQLLKRTNNGYDYMPVTYATGYETLNLSLGQKFNLRMTLLNGVLTVYVNGVQACTYDDSTNNYQYTSGECGLRVLYGDGVYDNVRVYGTALERPNTEETAIEATSYVDNFEDEVTGESPSHWQENYSETTVVDNWKVYEKDDSVVYGTEVTSGTTETWLHVFEKEPAFSAKFMVETIGENGEIRFITRRSPDTAFVNIGYDFEASKWYIASQESEAGGCEVFWASETSELNLGEWYTARVEANGETVTLYINEEVVITSDSVKRTGFGRIGFFTNDASMYVDNIDSTFKYGDIPQDGLISYVIEPNVYSNYMEIESTDDGNTLVAVGTTKKLSTDAGLTWTDITADTTWTGLKHGVYPTLLELHDGTYIQVLQNESFAVQSSTDMKNWETIGQIVPDDEVSDSSGRKVAVLHINSATEVELDNGTYRIFCPVAMRNHSDNGSILGHYTKIYYSDDGGATWQCSETTTETILPGYNTSTTWSESKIIKCADGTLRMYYSRNYLGCMQYTVSEDNGVTWKGMYQIPELQCAMTSFAIIEDPTERGTYYMLWMNGAADYLGSMLPRVRPCLLKSTDGQNWEFLMNCEYMTEFNSVTNGEGLYQILDPSLYVTEDYVYVTFGRSEREYAVNNANSHQAQRCYYLRVEKDKLTSRAWDASTIANMRYPKTIEISTMPQNEFEYGETFSFSDGILKITALDGTVTYEKMIQNCSVYKKPDTTAAGWTGSVQKTIPVYYVNGYYLSYDITIYGRIHL